MQQVEIAEKFQKEGIVHLENIISPEDIKTLKNFTLVNLEENQNKSFFLTSKSNEKISSFFRENTEIYEKIKSIVFDLSKNLKLSNFEDKKLYSVLRVLHNNRIKKESYNFHFDAHVITVLVPIIIPNRENSDNGHLLISPNLRKSTKSILKNIFEKLFYQSILKKFSKTKFAMNILNLKKIVLKPGSLLIFNGFRSLHGNLEIDEKDTRATLLVHFYDQFHNSKLVQLNRDLRIKKEKLIIKKNSQNG